MVPRDADPNWAITVLGIVYHLPAQPQIEGGTACSGIVHCQPGDTIDIRIEALNGFGNFQGGMVLLKISD